MLIRRSAQVFAATLALSVPLFATPSALAEDVRAAAVTITYDDSQATEYTDAITAGIAVWNDNLDNVQIDKVEPGGQADVSFVADPGWPRAELGPAMPGDDLTIWFGKEAVDDGYNLTRIASHEFGHSLGLPDVKPGPCSSLMSGSTGGVDCDNAVPNAEEIAAVEDNYAGGFAPRDREAAVVVVG
ncbi:snapalysin family zinc-dependent metalloprotease [Amycolatopsis magusensis]|uniref:Extracellular small neutral protease n=1 Tax=Amycolatopsis magusensis TaxID=882444 RepID=A0ABS4Q5Q5_9PSEU|nr:snapalysin family zinc-dependent metalloprotease [Amycolatopsis magusensis]MBP2187002.1 snapalysin [Amycolatopsis magusensis]MDI5979290.1 snapalysin family zinc-dependent metalloprotease [Amycolatopsis magusensis]